MVQLQASVRDGFEKNQAPSKVILAAWPNPRGPSADDHDALAYAILIFSTAPTRDEIRVPTEALRKD